MREDHPVKIYTEDGILYVEFHEFYDHADILVYDITGRLLHEGVAAGLSVYTYDITNYTHGSYLVIVLCGGRKYSEVITII